MTETPDQFANAVAERIAEIEAEDEIIPTSNFDNSAIWALRDSIAKAVEPVIVDRQRAWAREQPVEVTILPIQP